MRILLVVSSFFLLLSLAGAAELKIKVVDPHSAVVSGAQVVLYRDGHDRATAVETSSAAGVAAFAGIQPGEYRVQVLAAGFAAQTISAVVSQSETVTVTLQVASVSETVVVSATRTPLALEDTATEVETLDESQIGNLQPVTMADALGHLPGAVINTQGRRGGLASLFVRGGDSRYNKVIVDGVPVNDPGGTFDFGVVPLQEVDRMEFLRGAESTLYGSDAMTSVVETWTRNGSTRVPELRFGADGGNFSTAHGYSSLAGARARFDYNLFADHFATNGQGVNDDYFNFSQGANVGVALTRRVQFRLRARHSNNRSGVQGFWNFNGQPLVTPDTDQRARQNNLLASAELTVAGPSRWQHRFRGFEYHHQRANIDSFMDPGRVTPAFGGFNFDSPFSSLTVINRAGFEYEGQYFEANWARATFGYQFEDENGFVNDLLNPPPSHGLRLNHEVFAEQIVTWKRVAVTAGVRYVHNGSFGIRYVPRAALSFQVLRGGRVFSGTRVHGSYAEGFKEPRLEETFATGPFIIPNAFLKPEKSRSLEAGVSQNFLGGKSVFSATYYNNHYRDQIEFSSDPTTFIGQYVNLNRSLAHGAEVESHTRISGRTSLDVGYAYTSTQVLNAPQAFDPLLAAGEPLLRRPQHSGTALLNYSAKRWGGEVGGSFVGRRTDSDFFGLVPHVDHAAGYGRADLGGWFAVNRYMTAYLNIQNALNRHYEEAAGYPALHANFRAGMRLRVGGE